MHVNWKNCRFVSKLYELLTVHLSFPIGPHWQFGHVLTCLQLLWSVGWYLELIAKAMKIKPKL